MTSVLVSLGTAQQPGGSRDLLGVQEVSMTCAASYVTAAHPPPSLKLVNLAAAHPHARQVAFGLSPHAPTFKA